ncbi:MAG: sodium:solute symporter family protein [Candidatus Sumerlaeia bacterium]|nr:sodium:solute symporter family protein [Candidatus Sumerlaeia bacterium]
MNAILFGVLIYVLVQLAVGVVVSRRIASESDYILAGRRFGPWMGTFSFFATWFGAETCVGSAGRIYQDGLSGASADPFGYGFCLLLMGAVFAAPLWRRGLTTLADLYRQRYTVGVERLAVLLMVPTSVFWAAAQIRAFGQVLNASSGMGTSVAIAAAAVVAIIYTGFGGMRADVITDLIQGVMIILGLLILAAVLFPNWAHVQAAWATVETERLNLFGNGQSVWQTLEAWAVPVCGSVAAQELVARALATRSAEVARRSALLGGGLYLTVGLIPAFLGLACAAALPGLEDAEQFLPRLAQQHLHTGFYILFAGALVSAILSTVDSTLLAASALTMHNLVMPLRNGLTEAGKLRATRLGVAAFGLLAWYLALQADTVFELVESSSSFGSAGIFAITVLGLFTRLGGSPSAYAALLVGMLVWVIGTYVFALEVVYLYALGGAFAAYLLLSRVRI